MRTTYSRFSKICLCLILFPFWASAEQVTIPDYQTAKNKYFWSKLYPKQGTSLYCSLTFDNGGYFSTGSGAQKKMTIEHAYPADWMATHFGCDNRNSCDNVHYKRAEADLHNLWPAEGRINSSRGDKKFSDLDDSKGYHRFQEFCEDYERRGKRGAQEALVEPQDSAKGRIARSLLYMRDEYGFDLLGMDEMLKGWHEAYPVTNAEVWRNEAISSLQGTRNLWIDK